jgi:hypothetical protein
MIEYRFRVPNAAVFTLYLYSKALEYRFRVPTVGLTTLTEGSRPNGTTVFHKEECKSGHLVAVDAKMSLSDGKKNRNSKNI